MYLNSRDLTFKGMKCEWMTVKDEHLYVGGLGKEWTTPDGTVLNFNPMFVKRISMTGEVEHLNWYDRYIKLRSRAGIEFPGKNTFFLEAGSRPNYLVLIRILFDWTKNYFSILNFAPLMPVFSAPSFPLSPFFSR